MTETSCSICFEYITNTNVCITKCDHKFHLSCILQILNNECPLCRSKLYDEDIEDIEDDEAVKDINDFYDHIQIIMDNAERNNYPTPNHAKLVGSNISNHVKDLLLDVIDNDAIARAQAAGLLTVMDRCPAIEYRARA